MAYDAATGGYTRLVSVVDPQHQPARSIRRRARRRPTSIPSASIARSTRGSRRRRATSASAAPTSSGGSTRAAHTARRRATLPDGRRCRCSCSTNSRRDRRFLLTNPDGLFVDYDGLVLAVEKRHVERLAGVRVVHVLAGARAAGVERRRRRTARSSARVAPANHVRQRSEQPDQRATAGCPTTGRTSFRVMGVVQVPWTASWSRPTCSTSAASRGRRRPRCRCRRAASASCSSRADRAGCSSQSLLDLRVSKTLRVGDAGRVLELMLDVLNLLERHRRGSAGVGHIRQPQRSAAPVVRRSAPRDDRRAAESRALSDPCGVRRGGVRDRRCCPLRLHRHAVTGSPPRGRLRDPSREIDRTRGDPCRSPRSGSAPGTTRAITICRRCP